MPYQFRPCTYFIYHLRKKSWLSLADQFSTTAQWTKEFWDAHNFGSFDEARDRMEEIKGYRDDCFVFALDAVFRRSEDELHLHGCVDNSERHLVDILRSSRPKG